MDYVRTLQPRDSNTVASSCKQDSLLERTNRQDDSSVRAQS